MSTVYPTLPRSAVRDSFDDDDLSDVDDEVFIRDGKNGALKLDDEGGVKRPLMAPRRKCKVSHMSDRRRFPYKILLAPFCYGFLALFVLLGLIILVIFAVSIFPVPLAVLKNWLFHDTESDANMSNIIACTSLSTSLVWTRTLPKLTSEAPLRSNDVNGDGIEDIIVGFSTGLDAMDSPQYFCTLYFGSQTPCLGGVLVLDGSTGDTIWTHWTPHAIFSVDCGLDLTNDKIKDCVVSGRGGILHAVNGHDGTSIWELPLQDVSTPGQRRILDIYDAKYIPDVDGDMVGDVIASHTMQSGGTRISEIVLISGKTGNILHSVGLPKTEQLFPAPQMLIHPDGENILVVATSSEQQSRGGLHIVALSNLMYGDLKWHQLHYGAGKATLLPPVLADVTADGTEDIIAAMFNSTIIAYDGLSFRQVWNYTVPNSEIISVPIPGYYNDDDIPDFMVKHQIGPGFPTYFYTVATILDGKTGKPLLEKPVEDTLGRQMSGLSITVDGFGNDWFLHWSADCLYYEGAKNEYQFLKSQNLASQTRTDLCKLRFNSTLATKLLALSQHVGPPGISLYFSEDWKKLEYNNSVDPRKEAEKYLDTHPDLEDLNPEMDIPLVSERSPKVRKSHHRASSFRHKEDGDSFAISDNFYPGHRSSEMTNVNYENPEEFEVRDSEESNGKNAEANGSDDFNLNDEWRDSSKWDEEDSALLEKDYDDRYERNGDRALDTSQTSEVREQRSDASDARMVNNDTNEYKNQFDLSMDYTNGQSRYNNYYSSELNNRTINIRESADDANFLDFDFEDNEVGGEAQTATTRREAVRESDVETKGQKEIVEGSRNNLEDKPFINIDRRPKERRTSNFATKKLDNPGESSTGVNNDARPISKTTPRNISDSIAIHDRKVRRANATDISAIDEIDRAVENISGKGQNVFADITQNEVDASLERIFKRESMRNRKKKNATGRKRKSSKEEGSASATDKKSKEVKRQIRSSVDRSSMTDGIQMQPPTGVLLPSLDTTQKNSVDLVFSTFWLPPSETSIVLLQQDLDCIEKKKAKLSGDTEPQEKERIVNDCLAERGVNYKSYQEATDRENAKIALGQMTVYRMKVECACPDDMLPGQACKSISPQQSWPAHLGATANGYFKPLQKPST